MKKALAWLIVVSGFALFLWGAWPASGWVVLGFAALAALVWAGLVLLEDAW